MTPIDEEQNPMVINKPIIMLEQMPAHERSASRRYASNSKKKRSETVKDDNAKT